MAFVADEDDGIALAGEANGLEMDFGDEGTGGVDGPQAALSRGRPDGGRHAVSAIEDVGPFRNLADVVHKHDSALTETLNNRPIVHDLVVHIQRSAEQVQGPVEALDRHIDAGAKASRIGENDSHDGRSPSCLSNFVECALSYRQP